MYKRQCNKFLRVASGKQFLIEGHGNLVVDFQSGQDFVRIEIFNVAYVPSLGYHLPSIPSCIGDGYTFVFDTKGVTMHLKSGQELLVPPVGKMYFEYSHGLVSETEQACAVIAPGLLPTTEVDINACLLYTSPSPRD